MSRSKEQKELEGRFGGGSLVDRAAMLQYGELHSLCEMLLTDRRRLQKALDHRNQVEDKAHGLFTAPLPSGQAFAHTPEQCNPLGFVQVMRAAFEKLQASTAEDRCSLGQLLKVMKQWRNNWNAKQEFRTTDIDLEIVNLELMLKKEPVSNPFILIPKEN